MSRRLFVDISDTAKSQVLAAEEWWRRNRPKAPNAIREELERAASLISMQPDLGARARNVALEGVRRLHLARVRHYVYYHVVPDPDRVEILGFWHDSREGEPRLR